MSHYSRVVHLPVLWTNYILKYRRRSEGNVHREAEFITKQVLTSPFRKVSTTAEEERSSKEKTIFGFLVRDNPRMHSDYGSDCSCARPD